MLAAPPATNKPTAISKTDTIKVTECLISAKDDVKLPANEPGVLVTIPAIENGLVIVEQGTLLAQIDDRESQIKKKAAEIESHAAKEQAESTVAEDIADKTAAVAEAEHKNALAINVKSPGSIPKEEVQRKKLTYERYVLEAEKARVDRRVAGFTHEAKLQAVAAAENDIRKRRIEAPWDGVVEKILKREREWVTPGEAVIRFVRMDKLRVEGFLRADQLSPEEVDGQPVVVEVRVTRGGKATTVTVKGKVDFVSPVIEGDDYRIWTEVENSKLPNGQWLLRPGQYGDMVITLKPVTEANSK